MKTALDRLIEKREKESMDAGHSDRVIDIISASDNPKNIISNLWSDGFVGLADKVSQIVETHTISAGIPAWDAAIRDFAIDESFSEEEVYILSVYANHADETR